MHEKKNAKQNFCNELAGEKFPTVVEKLRYTIEKSRGLRMGYVVWEKYRSDILNTLIFLTENRQIKRNIRNIT